jgi:hypothetical protein
MLCRLRSIQGRGARNNGARHNITFQFSYLSIFILVNNTVELRCIL